MVFTMSYKKKSGPFYPIHLVGLYLVNKIVWKMQIIGNVATILNLAAISDETPNSYKNQL